jgi:hypothetical protein
MDCVLSFSVGVATQEDVSLVMHRRASHGKKRVVAAMCMAAHKSNESSQRLQISHNSLSRQSEL